MDRSRSEKTFRSAAKPVEKAIGWPSSTTSKRFPTPFGNRLPLTRMHFVQIVGALSITGYDSLDVADLEKPTERAVWWCLSNLIRVMPRDFRIQNSAE
jgi:hypothetical protein